MRAFVDPAGVTLDLGSASPDWRPTRQLLFSGLSWCLARRGLTLIHGAAVARGTESLVVLGGTGRGKSTVAVAALLAGWDVLADDLLLLSGAPSGPEVFGLPKRATVAPELASSFERSLPRLPDDRRDRRLLPMDALTPGGRSVRGVLLVGHHDDVGDLVPVAHDELMSELVPAFLESGRPGMLRRHLGLLASVAGLPGARLLHARPPEARVSRAQDLLEQAWHHAAGQPQ